MRARVLLDAVLAAPADDAPRLVYADWLMDRGDPRGEFIQVQCALARGEGGEELRRRERALLSEHEPAWTAALYGELPRPRRAGELRHDERSLLFHFRRGFVSRVSGSLPAFSTRAAAIWAAEPVRDLDLTTHGLFFELGQLPPPPHGLERLALKGQVPGKEATLLARSRAHLAGLRKLNLWGGIMLGNEGALALARSPYLDTLEELTFKGGLIDCAAALVFADPHVLPKLKVLEFEGHQIRDAGAEALVRRPGLERLGLYAGLISRELQQHYREHFPHVVVDARAGA